MSSDHLMKVKERNGKMYGIRCHPVILQLAITVLAKISQKVYQLLQPIMKLPVLSYVLKLQNEHGGGQDERESSCGVMSEGCRSIGEQYDMLQIYDYIFRKVYLLYDSMYCVEGFDFNIHNGATGMDPHLNFNVIAIKFNKMVSYNTSFYYLT